jgi:hypothetical protein
MGETLTQRHRVEDEGNEENFVNYRTLNGNVIRGYPLIDISAIPLGKQGIQIPNSHVYLSVEVFGTHLLLFLDECRHQLPNNEVTIYAPDDSFTLNEWLEQGFELFKISPRINSQGSVLPFIQAAITSDLGRRYYYLEWWNTDFGPFPKPIPESS